MRNASLRGATACLASAVLFYFGTGLHPIWYLTWLAPIPVLWLAGRTRASGAFLAAFLALFLGNINEFEYAHGLVGIPVAAVILFFAIPAAAFALAVLIWRFCVKRRAWWQAAVAFPCAWVAFEFLNASASPHGTFGSLAYSQMNCLAVLQVAAATGLWGITFVLLLAPSTAAALLTDRRAWRAGAGVAVVLAAVVALGEWRLHSALHPTGTVKAALISSDAEQDHWAGNDEQGLAILSRYAEQIESVHGAQVIVLPEDLGPVSPSASKRAAEILSAAAKESGAELVAGLRAGRTPPMLNEALVFSPHGTLEATYEKQHLIPGIEDGIVVGKSIATLPAPAGVEGVQICKDLDFPELSRAYGARTVGLLLVPAFDFDVDGWLHGRMAVMRGVESGFTVARSARHGILTVSNDRGQILAERGTSKAGFTILTASAPVAHVDTLYDRFGNWFPWASAALLIVALFTALFQRAAPRTMAVGDLTVSLR